MKLELDLTSSQKTTVINHSENDSGSDDVKKMLRSGISFAKEGNRLEARQMLLGVTEVEPNNETAWLWLASISEYPEELLVFLQNVLKINPENERALEWAKQTKSLLSKTFVQRGINAAQNNQKEFAKQCFLQGIVHDSENEMAWLWLASTSDSQEEKVSHLQQVLRINPDNETALSSLNSVKGQMSQGMLKKANSAAISGDHETARQTLNTIMKNSPNIEEAWILKAFLATDFYEKVECYEKALEINPDYEAAQAGLASLKMLMPKMPKPVVEVSEPAVSNQVVNEEKAVVEEVVTEEVEELVAQEEVLETPEPVEFDENFDLEQLVEESPVETLELEQELNEEIGEYQAPPESRAAAEEVYVERQLEEEAIHETQAGFKEAVVENPSQQLRVESIFNYDEVISQEEAFVDESQTAAELEFGESSNNPTQELDEEYAQNASASFSYSGEENVDELQAEEEVVASAVTSNSAEQFAETAETQNAAELEDFYTEQTVVSSEVSLETVVEESAVVAPKKEVRITEVYDAEVSRAEIYGSEFFANDGFVLVPQNDPFADHKQETVEFTYSETEETGDVEETVETQQAEQVIETEPVVETPQAEQVIETTSVVEIEPVVETQQTENFEPVVETQQAEEVATLSPIEEVAQTLETQQAEEVVETEPFVETQQVEQFVETPSVETPSYEAVEEQSLDVQQPEVTEEAEEVVVSQPVEYFEEVVEIPPVQQFEEVVESQSVEQFEEVVETPQAEQFQVTEEVVETPVEVVETEQAQVSEEVVEVEQKVEETVEAYVPEQVETEQVAEFGVAEEVEQFENPVEEKPAQFEQVVETPEIFEARETETQYAETPQIKLTHCPFCAAENQNQAIVCGSCKAMLSLGDLEVLISHQGVNQDLLLQAIEKMEVEKGLRDFDAEELTYLAIAHLNAKNLEKGFSYLQEASKLNPNDVILTSKIKFLTAHLEELKANKVGTIGKNRTILVVDDSPTVRKLISGKLEKCGHSVLSAIDGMDALAKINEVIPDLILLDITMPRLDGYQVCKLIRNNEMTKDVPIVMISGKDGFFDKVRGRMAGSSGYITKPFGPDTLMKTIETYLN